MRHTYNMICTNIAFYQILIRNRNWISYPHSSKSLLYMSLYAICLNSYQSTSSEIVLDSSMDRASPRIHERILLHDISIDNVLSICNNLSEPLHVVGLQWPFLYTCLDHF